LNQNTEPGTVKLEPDSDTPMTANYVGVLVLEAVIILALWLFGRMFS
jgi:hypothetical protein